MAKHPSTSIPKYRKQKRARCTDQAFVVLDGRRHYLGPYGSPESEEAYHRALVEWHATRGQASTQSLEETTVVELCAAYWRHAEHYYRHPDGEPTRTDDKIKQALKVLRRLYGSVRVSEYGPLALQATRQAWIDRELARNTINGYVSVIKRMFKWGVANELVPETTYRALTAVSGLAKGRSEARDPAPKKPVPEAHVSAIETFVSDQVWAIIRLQIATAARAGELLKMRPVDLDTSNAVWCYSPDSHKTAHHGHRRMIWLGPVAQSIIKPLLSGRPINGYLFSPRLAERQRHDRAPTHRRPDQRPNPHKTGRRVGDRYSVGSYRRAVQRACVAAGVPEWTPHRLRHNAGTNVRHKYGIEAARLVLGVSSGNMAEVYAERDMERAREIIAKIG